MFLHINYVSVGNIWLLVDDTDDSRQLTRFEDRVLRQAANLYNGLRKLDTKNVKMRES